MSASAMSIFKRADKLKYDKDMLHRRFDSLLKTVAETNKLKLKLGKGGKTDGKSVMITDPEMFFDMGMDIDTSILIALHVVIHEASHIMYSTDPHETLGAASEKYVPLGYDWDKLFVLIDLLEDWRVDYLMSKSRPGVHQYALDANTALIEFGERHDPESCKDPVHKLMKYGFTNMPTESDKLFDKVMPVFEEFKTKAVDKKTSNTDLAVDYGVSLYDIIYGKPKPGKGKSKDKSEGEGGSGTDNEGNSDQSEIGEGEGDTDDTEIDGDDGNDEDTPDVDDAGGKGSDGEETDAESKPLPADTAKKIRAAKEKSDMASKPAIMSSMIPDASDGAEADKPEKVGYGNSYKSKSVSISYPGSRIHKLQDAPIKNADIIAKLVDEGEHLGCPVSYVEANKTEDYARLHNLKTYENSIRGFIMQAKRLMMRDTKGFAYGKSSGTIMPTKVWRAPACNDVNVFKRRIDESKGDIAVYVLCDASGSMHGSSITNARIAVYTLARMLSHYEVPTKCVAFDCYDDLTTHGETRMACLKDWEQKSCDSISNYLALADNRDGLSINVAALELAQRPETHKLLVVLSDGDPGDGTTKSFVKTNHTYSGSYGVQDTAKYVRAAQKMGIDVVGVYMTCGGRAESHKTMYGNDLFVITDPKVIPTLLLRVLAKYKR